MIQNFWTLNILELKHFIRSQSSKEFFTKLFVHDPLSILLYLLLFTSFHQSSGDTLKLLADYSLYFLPLFAFTSALGLWENDLFSETSELRILNQKCFWGSHLLTCLTQVVVVYVLFMALNIYLGMGILKILLDSTFTLVFLMLGDAVGFRFGLKGEKSINNWNHIIVWVLGLGPGPFLKNASHIFKALFPGGLLHLPHGLALEFTRAAMIALAAYGLLLSAQKPRSYKVFSRSA